MNPNDLPEGDRIYELFTPGYKPQVVRIALALDVFSPLAAGAATADEVAHACACDPAGIGHLLNFLTSLNLLIREGGKYRLGADAAAFLVPGEKAYAGDLILHFTSPEPFDSLQECIRRGRARSMDTELDFAQDAWIESHRQARLAGSLELWKKAGIVPGKDTRLKLLDLACGCAIKSLALAQQAPGVQVTCLDTPLVLEAARDLAKRLGVGAQARYLSKDLLTVDLGVEKYDVCLLGQISHYLTGAQNRNLFGRILKALVPGGKLVLDVPMTGRKPDESTSFISLFLWANSGGRAYTYEEYRIWLMMSGFKSVKQLSKRSLLAVH
jgi:SAM-dependent methyltransferase